MCSVNQRWHLSLTWADKLSTADWMEDIPSKKKKKKKKLLELKGIYPWCSDRVRAHILIAPVGLHAGFLQLTSSMCVCYLSRYMISCVDNKISCSHSQARPSLSESHLFSTSRFMVSKRRVSPWRYTGESFQDLSRHKSSLERALSTGFLLPYCLITMKKMKTNENSSF